jgi:hypothetical protein
MSKARVNVNKLNDIVSVKDFGATGNGATDDTAALQAAFDSGAKQIFFPAGTYKITSTETNRLVLSASNVTLNGYGATILNGTSRGFATWEITGQHVEVFGLTIDGNNTSLNCLMIADTAKNVTLRNVEIKNYAQQSGDATFAVGLVIQNGSDSTLVDNCYIHDIQSSVTDISRGVLATGYDTASTHATNVVISNCLFETIGPAGDGDAIVFQPDTETLECSSRVVNCTFKSCLKRAVKISASGCQVIGGYCEIPAASDMYAGVSVYGDNCSVIGFSMRSISTGAADQGIEVGVTGQTLGNNTLIQGCSIKMAAAGSSSRDGFVVRGSVNNVTITGNIADTCRFGVNLNNSGENIAIIGNVIRVTTQNGVQIQGESGSYPDGVAVTGNAFANITASAVFNGGATRVTVTGNSSDGSGFGHNAPLLVRQTVANNTFSAGPFASFGDAPPTTGTWVRSDIVWNTSAGQNAPAGWLCTTGGTPGTWFPFGAPANVTAVAASIAAVGNAINTTGKFAGLIVRDTTNNRLMVARGSAAADPWDVVDGSATVTPA